MTCGAQPSEDDQVLLERYLSDGDEAAMGILYVKYSGELLRFATGRLQDREAARDLVQDTWEAILTWRGLSTRGSFRGLVYKIAHNLCLRRERDQGRHERALNGASTGGNGVTLRTDCCAWCAAPAVEKGMCSAHARRAGRGATDAQMEKKIQKRRKRS